jgi:HK97 family phage portal protein
MIGDLEHATFSNIEHQSIDYVKYTLNPWICRWEQAIKRALLTEEEQRRYYARFNVDGLLRGDYKSRMEGYAIARRNGWMSTNDIRDLEDQDLVPKEEGGDLYIIEGNMTKLADVGAFAGKQSGKEES